MSSFKSFKKRLIAWLLLSAMVASLIPAGIIAVSAEDDDYPVNMLQFMATGTSERWIGQMAEHATGNDSWNYQYQVSMWIRGEGNLNIAIYDQWGGVQCEGIAIPRTAASDEWEYVTVDIPRFWTNNRLRFMLQDKAGTPGMVYITDISFKGKDSGDWGRNLLGDPDFLGDGVTEEWSDYFTGSWAEYLIGYDHKNVPTTNQWATNSFGGDSWTSWYNIQFVPLSPALDDGGNGGGDDEDEEEPDPVNMLQFMTTGSTGYWIGQIAEHANPGTGDTWNYQYQVSMWIRGDGNVNLDIRDEWWNALYNQPIPRTAANDEWEYVTIDITPFWTNNRLRIMLRDSAGTPGTVYITGVSFSRKLPGGELGPNLLGDPDFLGDGVTKEWSNYFTGDWAEYLIGYQHKNNSTVKEWGTDSFSGDYTQWYHIQLVPLNPALDSGGNEGGGDDDDDDDEVITNVLTGKLTGDTNFADDAAIIANSKSVYQHFDLWATGGIPNNWGGNANGSIVAKGKGTIKVIWGPVLPGSASYGTVINIDSDEWTTYSCGTNPVYLNGWWMDTYQFFICDISEDEASAVYVKSADIHMVNSNDTRNLLIAPEFTSELTVVPNYGTWDKSPKAPGVWYTNGSNVWSVTVGEDDDEPEDPTDPVEVDFSQITHVLQFKPQGAQSALLLCGFNAKYTPGSYTVTVGATGTGRLRVDMMTLGWGNASNEVYITMDSAIPALKEYIATLNVNSNGSLRFEDRNIAAGDTMYIYYVKVSGNGFDDIYYFNPTGDNGQYDFGNGMWVDIGGRPGRQIYQLIPIEQSPGPKPPSLMFYPTGNLYRVDINNQQNTITAVYWDNEAITVGEFTNGFVYENATSGAPYSFAVAENGTQTIGELPDGGILEDSEELINAGGKYLMILDSDGKVVKVFDINVQTSPKPDWDVSVSGVWQPDISTWNNQWQLVSKADIISQLKSAYGPNWQPIGDPDNHGGYVWDRSPGGVKDYEEWLGRPSNLAEDFSRDTSWNQMNGNAGIHDQNITAWTEWGSTGTSPDWQMLLSYPPFPRPEATGTWWEDPSTNRAAYQKAANGDFNDYYRAYAENLLANGYRDSIIRFGHEFNGEWYQWAVVNDENAGYYKAAFKNFVETVLAVQVEWNTTHGSDKADFTFCWNPTIAYKMIGAAWIGEQIGGVYTADKYTYADENGDTITRPYVDYIGIDIYDNTDGAMNGWNSRYAPGSGYTPDASIEDRLSRQQAVWTEYLTSPFGLDWFSGLADDTGIPIGFCEWGVADRTSPPSGYDNPYFIVKMYEWMLCNNVAFNVRFNVPAGDLSSDLFDVKTYPNAAAQFQKLWNPNFETENSYVKDGVELTPYYPIAPKYSPETLWADAVDAVPSYDGEYYMSATSVQATLTNASTSSSVFANGHKNIALSGLGADVEFRNVPASTGLAFSYNASRNFIDAWLNLYVYDENGTQVDSKEIFMDCDMRAYKSGYKSVIVDGLQIPEGGYIKIAVSDKMAPWGGSNWQPAVEFDLMLFLGTDTDGEYTGNPNYVTPPPSFPPARTTSTYSGWKGVVATSWSDSRPSTWYTGTLAAGTYEFSGWFKATGSGAQGGFAFLGPRNDANHWGMPMVNQSREDIPDDGEWHYLTNEITVTTAAGYEPILFGQNVIMDAVNFGPKGGSPIYKSNFDAWQAGGSLANQGGTWWGNTITDFGLDNNSYVKNGDWAIKINSDAVSATLNATAALTKNKEYTFALYAIGDIGDSVTVKISNGSENYTKTFVVSDIMTEYEFIFTPSVSGDYTVELIDFRVSDMMIIDCLLLCTEGTNNLIPNCDFELGDTGWTMNGGVSITNFSEAVMLDGIYDDFKDGMNKISASVGVEAGAPAVKWGLYGKDNNDDWAYVLQVLNDVTLETGKTYEVGLTAKGGGSFSICEEVASGGTREFGLYVVPNGNWADYTTTFTAGHGGKYKTMIAQFNVNGGDRIISGEIFIEKVWVREVIGTNEYGQNLIGDPNFQRNIIAGDSGTENWYTYYNNADWDDIYDYWSRINLSGTEPSLKRIAGNLSNDAYAVYGLNSDIQTISLDAAIAGSFGDVNEAVRFYVSGDGESYAGLTGVTSVTAGGITTFECYDIPDGMRFLKIAISPVANIEDILINKVYINVRLAPISLVTSIIPDANGVYEFTESETNIQLANTNPDARIRYSINGGAAVTYTGGNIKISAANATVTAWAEQYGKYSSVVSTFVFRKNTPPLIDRYGQWAAPEWANKIKTDDDLFAAKEQMDTYFTTKNRPSEWDIYGGLSGTKDVYGFEQTGFYHVENKIIDGVEKSFMVDPLGNLYFSASSCGIGYVEETYTIVEGREEIYEDLSVSGARSGGNYSFFVANQIRLNGGFDLRQYRTKAEQQAIDLGFTSLGAWSNVPYESDEILADIYWVGLPDYLLDSTASSWARLYDVFHPSFESDARRSFAGTAANKDNPNFLGYFFANELHYDYLQGQLIGTNGAGSYSRAKFVDMLEEKYITISDLNAAWSANTAQPVNYASFSAMKSGALRLSNKAAEDDFYDFLDLYLDKLYSTVAIVREYDPNHMLLGDRYLFTYMLGGRLSEALVKAAGRYMDAISYNYYTLDVDVEHIQHLYEVSGRVPFMFTEFHFPDPERGMSTSSQCLAESEEEKGKLYRNYVEKAAASGMVVGTHWFINLDQAPTGRHFDGLDGEAAGIGLYDVTGMPYYTFTEYVSGTNYRIYDLVQGNIEPETYNRGDGGRDKNIDVPKTNSIVTIGEFAEWQNAANGVITNEDICIGQANDNFGADFSMIWDDEYLYIQARVKDDTPLANECVADYHDWMWDHDCIELFFGPYDVNAGGGLKFSDHQLLIGGNLNSDDSISTKAYWLGNHVDDQPEVEVAAELCDGGYIIEAKIKLSDIYVWDEEVSIVNGQELKFDIGLDYSDYTGGRTHQYAWSGDASNSGNRGAWGMLTFVTDDNIPESKPKAIQNFEAAEKSVSGTVDEGTVTFTWTDPNNTDSAVASYELYSTNGGNKWLDIPVIITTDSSITLTFEELGIIKSGDYDFRIKAVNAKGSASFVYLGGENRYRVNVTVEVDEPTAKPKVITDFNAVLNGEAITFTWVNPNPEKSATTVETYSLYKTSGGSVWLEEAITINAAETTVDEGITSITLTFEELGITKSGNYDFRIKANNNINSASYVYIGGESRYKVKVEIESLIPTAKPKAVTAFNATSDGETVTFTWINPNNSATAVEYYELTRTNTGNTWQTPITIDASEVIVDEGITSITYTLEELGIDKNGSYDFRIKAINDEGVSALTYLGGGTSSDPNRYRLNVTVGAVVVH